MSAARLREAAAVMREAAEAAMDNAGSSRWEATTRGEVWGRNALICERATTNEAIYIAMADPAVGVAIADFLDEMGWLHDHGDSGGPLILRRTLAIANTILAGGAS